MITRNVTVPRRSSLQAPSHDRRFQFSGVYSDGTRGTIFVETFVAAFWLNFPKFCENIPSVRLRWIYDEQRDKYDRAHGRYTCCISSLDAQPLPSAFVSFRSGLVNHPLTSVHGYPLKTFDRQAEELQIYGFVDRRRNSLFSKE